MVLTSLAITVLYAIFIISLVWGFDKVNVFEQKAAAPNAKFSLIIPFRNEAENLPYLLDSISLLEYPPSFFEILLVDDESEDASVEIIEQFQKNSTLQITLLKNERRTASPKKDALFTAIQKAKYDWILTTDADSTVPNSWLQDCNTFLQEQAVEMVCSFVNYCTPTTFLERFQQLELLSLMGATVGGFGIRKPFLCNGANFAYSKVLFKKLNGFEGNSNIASGDDIFLLEKALRYDKSKVGFLKSRSSTVLTQPAPTLSAMIQQRIRWASKSSHYQNTFGKFSGLVVFLMNALLVSLLVLSILQLLPSRILLYCFVVKFYCDFWLILKTALFLESRKALPSYLLSSVLYPFFSVLIGISSMFPGYKWKDRQFKK